MNVGRAFTYVFSDPRWLGKLLIGAGLVLVPIVGWLAVAGYGMRITRRVAAGHDVPLPSWDERGDLLGDGLRFFGVLLAWLLILLLVLCPLLALVGSLDSTPNPGWALVLNLVVGVVVGLPVSAALGRAAVLRDGMEGVNVPRVLGTLSRGFRGYAIAAAVTIAVSTVSSLGLVSDLIAPLLINDTVRLLALGFSFVAGTFYSACYNGHLTGQAYWLAEAADRRLGSA
jgi:hypothetical protein